MADKQKKGAMGASAAAGASTDGTTAGKTVGGAAGAATGAAIGSLAGPIGTIIGGLAGAVGGWWTGREVTAAASTFTPEDDTFYQTAYTQGSAGGSKRPTYADARPALQLGQLAGMNPDYTGRSFEEIEPQLETAYTSAGQRDWRLMRDDVRSAYLRGREVGDQRLTLAEEELRIGKRQVQSGEVTLHKTVETERVAQTIDLTHEEVTIERRPVTDPNASTNVEISADEIRIPLMAEEAVVEKRVVGKEEVVVRKAKKTDTQTVEADLRKERLEVDDSQTGLARGTERDSRDPTRP